MKTRATSQAFLPASPLAARGEDEGEGFQTGAKLNAANPHPTLSQTHSGALTGAYSSVSPKRREKGEGDQRSNASEEQPNALR
jgi:hypothetical protein